MSHRGIVVSDLAEVFAAPRRRGQPLSTLRGGHLLTVTARASKWCTVTFAGEAGDALGYVEASCISLVDPDGRGHLAADPDLQAAGVDAPPDGRLAGREPRETAVARAWNLYGGLLSEMSGRLGIDPAYAVAVLCVESGGQGFGPDGRVVIRLENHILRRYLGDGGAAAFNRHFRITGDQPWLGHAFRESAAAPWTAFHGSQALEWRAYEVACRLDVDAATRSISMGLPQVMGFNHGLLGYETPRGMLAFMGADVRFQLLGLFDFIAGAGGRGPALAALRRADFDGFVTLYNGPGQARYYGDLIHSHVQAFHRLRPAPVSEGVVQETAKPGHEKPAAAAGRRYEVRPGDTLGAIAGRHGVTVDALARANGIANPNLIIAGQVLTVPPAAPPPPPVVVPSAPPEDVVDGVEAEGHAYVVRPGDTLGAIAGRAGTSMAALAEANGITNPNLIFPGQVIRTPQPI